MTTQTEALKLALEALEDMAEFSPSRLETPITAIKEALLQPEQEPEDLTIAYMAGLSRGKDLAPQRTWVGLSVFEINDLVDNTEYEDYRGLVERTEDFLKEKNT